MQKKLTVALLMLIGVTSLFANPIPGHILLKLPENLLQKSQFITNPYFCGAVKIAKKQYLTASHCTKPAVPELGKIAVGEKLELKPSGVKKKTVTVTKIQYPKETLEIAQGMVCSNGSCYAPKRLDWLDIALVTVDQENDIAIAKIPTGKTNLYKNMSLIVSGSAPAIEMMIHETSDAKLTLIQEDTGFATLTNEFSEVNFGDSGSPIWLKDNDGFRLVGITSFLSNKKQLGFTILSANFLNLFQE